MFVVTGGLGFIGSQVVAFLQKTYPNNTIVIVDWLKEKPKFLNLLSSSNCSLIEPKDLSLLLPDLKSGQCRAIFHLGANSSTTCKDGNSLYEYNYRFSTELVDLACKYGVHLVNASSASVYGASPSCSILAENERPLNHYAFYKLLVDQYIRSVLSSLSAPITSIRFFNVYGFGEFFKGDMASLPYKFYKDLSSGIPISLFGASHGCSAGNQSRDFVYVDDIVTTMHRCFTNSVQGIYNLGSGTSRSFNDLAFVCINTYYQASNLPSYKCLQDAVDSGVLAYTDFPSTLVNSYQPFTLADHSGWSTTSIQPPATSLEAGIDRYYQLLSSINHFQLN